MFNRKIVLTQKQQETLDFLKAFIARAGEPPTIAELRDGLKLSSLRSVTQRLEALENKGFIGRDRFKHRGITILEGINPHAPFGTVQLPVIASAGCDAAKVYAEGRYDEYIAVDKKIVDPRKDIVAIKAVGNSMVDAGIKNGDYVLVEVTEGVGSGDRVIAILGDMAVIKRLKQIPGAIVLESESKNGGYAPIVMREDFKVFGKVLSVIQASYRGEDDIQIIYDNPNHR
ncbi:MAG: transcriptional repressor LexA [Candidatus Taylorbacteria bacterium]|nr:transcriptional repressor LexA [Candidatus Taylorbacteria bacterium]